MTIWKPDSAAPKQTWELDVYRLKVIAVSAFLFFIFLMVSPDLLALRCGTNLVHEGDLKIQVEDKCGEPVTKEVIGYTLRRAPHAGGFQDREHQLEEWIYKFQGKYYDVLTFEAGRLVRIEKIRR